MPTTGSVAEQHHRPWIRIIWQLLRLQEGRANQLYGVMLRLQVSLECGAFVGTYSSNFGRLIENLRGTAGCKAMSPFADAAQLNVSDYDYWGGLVHVPHWRQQFGQEAP
jgi:hypothetical protein